MNERFCRASAIALAASACHAQPATTPADLDNVGKAVAFLKSIETGDASALAYAGAYKQHDLAIPDGVAGLRDVLAKLPSGSAKVHTVRAFADGDFVVTHTEYDFFGPKIGFDVFRFENGTIAEHWDNLQETPAAPNPSGHTMTDGPRDVTDRDRTAENKRLVRGFVDDILLAGKLDKLPAYVDGDHYIQHNAAIGDGVAALGAALQALAKAGTPITYSRVHNVLGAGNFVLVTSEGAFGDRPTAYYDLFRVDRGKIVEHWDVIEAIPPREQWKNGNGKF